MATFTPPNEPWKAGYPSQSSDTVTAVAQGLIVGETPPVVMLDMPVAASQTLLMYSPVAISEDGEVTIAAAGAPAAGIVMRPIVTGTGDAQGVEVLRAGCLNMDLIAWPESYNTDELKLNAFAGAPTPTNITVRKVRAGSIVAAP